MITINTQQQQQQLYGVLTKGTVNMHKLCV